MSLTDDILAEALPDPIKTFFGDEVTYTPLAGSPYTLTVIAADPKPLEQLYPGNLTLVDVLLSDMEAAPVKGDKITMGSTEYTVFSFEADNIGPSGLFARLALQKRA